jgi:hypothetical protein
MTRGSASSARTSAIGANAAGDPTFVRREASEDATAAPVGLDRIALLRAAALPERLTATIVTLVPNTSVEGDGPGAAGHDLVDGAVDPHSIALAGSTCQSELRTVFDTAARAARAAVEAAPTCSARVSTRLAVASLQRCGRTDFDKRPYRGTGGCLSVSWATSTPPATATGMTTIAASGMAHSSAAGVPSPSARGRRVLSSLRRCLRPMPRR